MSLKEKIKEDLKDSMKKGEATRVSTVKMLIAAINNKEIELGKKEAGLNDEEIMDAIRSEAKKRKDAGRGCLKFAPSSLIFAVKHPVRKF